MRREKTVKDKKQKILLSVLILLAVFIWARAIKDSGGKRPIRGDKGNRKIYSDGGSFAPLMAAGPRRREKIKSPYPEWGPNPFVFKETPGGVEVKKIILQGILIDEKDSQALINDHYVKKGDSVDEYIVVDIQQDKVILNDGMNDKELRLGE